MLEVTRSECSRSRYWAKERDNLFVSSYVTGVFSGTYTCKPFEPLVFAQLLSFILPSKSRSQRPTSQQRTLSAGAPGSRSNTIIVGRSMLFLRESDVCSSRSARFAAHTSVGRSLARQ